MSKGKPTPKPKTVSKKPKYEDYEYGGKDTKRYKKKWRDEV
jgi:hypothetical protein